MKNETLYWTIGGVALALLALYAMSRGGGSSTTTSSGGGGISSADLTSQVNAANANAAAVEGTRIGAIASYATHSSDNQASIFSKAEDTAAGELATLENAHTARLANYENFASNEYQAHENALTAQGAIQGAVSEASINAGVQIQQSADSLAAAQANARAQVDTAKANKPSWFQSLMGAVGSVFKVTTKL